MIANQQLSTEPGQLHTVYLGSLGGAFITPWAINSRGQVVGQSYITGNLAAHTFLWQKGTMTDLGTLPGDGSSTAFGINDQGDVVGGSCQNRNINGKCRAFLWQNGVMLDLNTLACSGSSLYLAFANDINSHGEIAGFAEDRHTKVHYGFLATPTHDECGAGTSAGQGGDLPKSVTRRARFRF